MKIDPETNVKLITRFLQINGQRFKKKFQNAQTQEKSLRENATRYFI
jgi:hypothetical protein